MTQLAAHGIGERRFDGNRGQGGGGHIHRDELRIIDSAAQSLAQLAPREELPALLAAQAS